ncbi:hypothetical protein GWK47_040026 [Chionoecetes opilio]|uniref:Uncharacterized protein n=1 Tax=Chionoecetes opilio TaxID=41210 RepID=A0A8J4YCE2_CHIOP|nr:hypothetical protein GWK47_040026 [Chionoecetes opilio]
MRVAVLVSPDDGSDVTDCTSISHPSSQRYEIGKKQCYLSLTSPCLLLPACRAADRYHHALHADHHPLLPYFHEHQNASSITAQLGSTAFLHCRVNRLGDKTGRGLGEMETRSSTDLGLHTYSNDVK